VFFQCNFPEGISMNRKYHCPRCKNENIIEYDDTFDCPACNQEFEKKDFDLFDEENILSVQEKLNISKAILEKNKK